MILGISQFAGFAHAADFYVATNGLDSNPGTEAAPFATVAQARNAVRAQILNGLTNDVLVLIHGGVYALTNTLAFGPLDSGTEQFSIAYASYPGEKVILSGGRAITNTWQKGTGQIWTTHISDVQSNGWYFRQLFINGNRAVRARMPNVDDPTNWWYINSATFTDLHDGSTPYYTLGVTHPIQSWSNPADIEIIYMYNDEGTRRFLGSANGSSQTITFPVPGAYTNWTSGCMVDPPLNESCFFENALEFLDEAGEWYLERNTGVLSYWPRSGEDMMNAEVIAPVVQNTLLSIIGTTNNLVTNLHFQGIHLEYVDRFLPAYGQMKLFCAVQFTQTPVGPEVGPIEAAVEFTFARCCSFIDGEISHVGGYGLCLRKGTANNVIEGNEIGGAGAGGIGVSEVRQDPWDTWPWNPPPGTNDYRGFHINNNHIHDCGLDYIGGVGMLVGVIQESIIAHNLIHDTSYSGIQFAGDYYPSNQFTKDNTIEYNQIYRAMKTAVDGGGLYITFAHAGESIVRGNMVHDMLWNPYARGNILNGIHDVKSSIGLYLDGNCRGVAFENNLVYSNAGGPLLFNTSKAANTWLDNLFEKDGCPPPEFIEAMQVGTGLEPAYRLSLLNGETNICNFQMLTNYSGWTAYQYDLPNDGRGVIEIVQQVETTNQLASLMLTGLNPCWQYALEGYAGGLAIANSSYNDGIWFGDSDTNLAASYIAALGDLLILSNAVPIQLTNATQVNGIQLVHEGLPVQVGGSPEVAWVAYKTTDFSGWRYRSQIAFSGYTQGEVLTNFPLLVVLSTNMSGFAYNQFNSPNGWDLRFLAADGVTELPYEIEQWNTNGNSYVWLQVPTLSGTNTTITACWGNPAVTVQQAYTTNGAVWVNGFVSVWHLNQASGRLLDSTVNKLAGAPNGGVTQGTTGEVGPGCTFDGASATKITTSAANLPTGAAMRTMAIWFRKTGQANVRELMGCGANGPAGSRLGFWFVSGAPWQVGVENCGSLRYFNWAYDANWHYLAMTLPQGSNDLSAVKMYLDGQLQNGSGSGVINTATNELRISGIPTVDGYAFDGQADEARISSVDRSPGWILAEWLNMASNQMFNSYGVVKVLAAAPNGLTATPVTTNQINLTWSDNATNELGYVIDRSVDGNAWNRVVVTGSDVTSYSDVGLVTGTMYYYRVAATNGAGISAYVATNSLTLTPYEQWQQTWFTPAQLANTSISGDLACPAGDGICNLLKYAFGLNPFQAGGHGLPHAQVQNGYLTLMYPQNKVATDLIYVMESTTNLNTGSWNLAPITELGRADYGGYWEVTVQDSIPINETATRFLRLKVTKQ